MKKFDWKEFTNKNNKIAVHCKTEIEARDFYIRMHEHGIKWKSGNSYLDSIEYSVYKNETCYSNIGQYCNKKYCEKNGYKVLEYSDYFIAGFMKDDLENGMVVEYRNGERRLVHNQNLIQKYHYMKLEEYDIFLTMKDRKFKDYDILKVYKSKAKIIDDLFYDNSLELIWERKILKQ